MAAASVVGSMPFRIPVATISWRKGIKCKRALVSRKVSVRRWVERACKRQKRAAKGVWARSWSSVHGFSAFLILVRKLLSWEVMSDSSRGQMLR